jgi:hypothetical protein
VCEDGYALLSAHSQSSTGLNCSSVTQWYQSTFLEAYPRRLRKADAKELLHRRLSLILPPHGTIVLVLYCTALHCALLYYTVLHCPAQLHFTELLPHYTVLY